MSSKTNNIVDKK